MKAMLSPLKMNHIVIYDQLNATIVLRAFLIRTPEDIPSPCPKAWLIEEEIDRVTASESERPWAEPRLPRTALPSQRPTPFPLLEAVPDPMDAPETRDDPMPSDAAWPEKIAPATISDDPDPAPTREPAAIESDRATA